MDGRARRMRRGLRCGIVCLVLEKTFERLVHARPTTDRPARTCGFPICKRAPFAAVSLGGRGAFLKLALPPVLLFFFTPAFYSNHRQREQIFLTRLAIPKMCPERANPLLKPSSRGPPQRLP
jgi:hypothetical protein